MDSKESRIVKSYDNLLRQVPGLNVGQYEKNKGLPALKNTTQIENHRRHARESPRRGSYFWTFSSNPDQPKRERQEVCIVRKPNLLFTTELVSHFYHNTSTHYRLHTLPETLCSTQVIMGHVDSNEPRIENKESNNTISLQI